MPIQLTEQQQRALDASDAQPPRVVDPRHGEAYVLIPLTEYESVRELVEDEQRQRALAAVALRNVSRRLLEDS
jgi:PHD/YefM family antitoxin component YafN of YafNO toxin-antitoxin module